MSSENILTPEFRVSFPSVFRPAKNKPGFQSKYEVTMLFPKGTDLTMLKSAANMAAFAMFGEKLKDSAFTAKLRSPFRDQGEKSYEGYEAGAIAVKASSEQRPGLVDAKVQDIIEEKDFYPGCYARATIRAFAYDQSGNRGVSFGLQNIQKTREGDPLGGRTRPSDDFQPIAGAAAAGTASSGAAGLFT